MPFQDRALIFDVDGTLVDSNDAHAAAWAEALRDFDIDREIDAIVPLIGMGADRLLPRMAGVTADSDLGRQIAARRSELFRQVYFAHVAPFRGVRELFERLRADGVRIGIASSAKLQELEPLLDVARVRDLLDRSFVTSADDVASSKPAPDAVEAALKRLGTEPGATLMVGDSPYDIEAAQHAGLGTLALRCGRWEDRDLTDAYSIYDDPKHLLDGYVAGDWDWPQAPRPRPGTTLPANSSLR